MLRGVFEVEVGSFAVVWLLPSVRAVDQGGEWESGGVNAVH
jgi:hypothetical protein